MTYTPEPPPSDPVAVPGWVYRELLRIAAWLAEVEGRTLPVLHRPPRKPRVGMIVYADGTDWNPGAGEGLYVRTTGGWTKL